MRTYNQLTSEQRYQISVLKRMEHSQTEIAKELELHKSTISRELSRNTGERGYRPKQANEKALARRARAMPRKRILAETGKWWKRNCAKIGVLNKFRDGWNRVSR